MSKIKVGSVFGNYKWTAEYELNAEQMEALAPYGMLNILQRVPSSNAEKAMAGYEKRPKGFKRTDIPFEESKSSTLRDAVSTLVIPDSEGEELFSIKAESTNVEEYLGSTQDTKYAAERAKYNQRKDSLQKLADTVGYDGELGDGIAANAPEEFLKAIRAWVKAQADKL